MSTIRYQHFARPNFLKRISSDVLRQFLDPWRTYLESRALEFGSTIDCDHLGGILATPDADTPTELIEALEICDAVCSTECLEELVALDTHRETRILAGRHSLTDAVLLTWVVEPEQVERLFNRAALEIDRSLKVYTASEPIRADAFGTGQVSRLRHAFSPMFQSQLRGNACRITAHERPDGGHALVISHGDPINKAEAINDESGETESIVFRPESIDLAFYDPSRNEWRISGRGKWLQDTYIENIAKALHQGACVLSRSASYTLRPLLEHGLAALDVQTDLVRNVRLAELQMSVCGATMRLSGRELHHAFEALEDPLNNLGEPQLARLSFTMANRRSALNVTIHVGKAIVRGDIDNPAIEEWLMTAGFLIHESTHVNEAAIISCN